MEPVASPAEAPLLRPEVEGERATRRRTAAAVRPWRIAMRGRDPLEAHRSSTPLELFFDLVFVVAVAQAALGLHHSIVDGHVFDGVLLYLVVFFTIWWPWVNFTWFASAFDTDDVPYRLLTFVQMTGVLIVAAGVPRVFESFDFSIAVVGYVVMRIALVGQWLRVAHDEPRYRATAMRFAIAITAVQVLWIVRLAIPGPVGIAVFLVLGVAELLIPAWAERAGDQTPWHPEHIAERYGLFTIIVLGEGVLAATVAVQQAIGASGVSLALCTVAAGGLLLLFALWWAYFKLPTAVGHHLRLRAQLAWSYWHYAVFASIAALGAGIQVAVEGVTEPDHVAPRVAALAVAIPAVTYTAAVAVLHHPGEPGRALVMVVPSALGVLVLALAAGSIGVPLAVLLIGLLVAVSTGWHVAGVHRAATA